MATTISCEVMTGTGRMPRVTINGQQFIECEIMRGTGRMPDANIGSKAQVLNVKAWTPAQSSAEALHGRSVIANIEALNSVEKDVFFDVAADYLGGTFDDTEMVGDELNLVTTPFTEDWEGVTPLNDWTQRWTTGNFSVIDDGSGNKVLRGYVFNQEGCRTADDGPNASDVEVRTRYQYKNSGGKVVGVVARITGSGSACRGYEMLTSWGGNYVQLRRIVGDGGAFGLGTQNLGVSHSIDTWYWIAYRVVGDNHYAKWWVDGSAEPGSWTWIDNDSTHDGPGDVGVFFDSGSPTENYWFDDFRAESIPPAYDNNGTWVDFVDVTSVDHYSHALISWVEDTPANTTVQVAIRWPGQSLYQVQTANPQKLHAIPYEQDMRAGSTKDVLEIKVTLTTTDPSATPTLTDLRVYFNPGREEELEITVHGESCTPANGLLAYWGRGWIGSSGNPPVIEKDWSDLYVATAAWWLARDLQTVTAALEYWGNAIDSITFGAEASKYRLGYGPSYWSVPVTPYDSGPTVYEWTALAEWYPMGHNYEWFIIDQGQAIHADAKWLVGHIQLDNTPGSMLVGLLALHNNPGSLLVEGYKIDATPGMLLVQGPRIDNQPGMVMPAEEFIYNTPGSLLVGVREIHNQPGMFLVYGVNREGSVFVSVIDDNTYQTLLDHGITFS